MKCYCYESNDDFVFCIENAEAEHEDVILHAWFEKADDIYTKKYPMQSGVDDAWYKKNEYKELIKCNFAKLGPSMFSGKFVWKNVMVLLAQKFSENGIEWYVFGSGSEKMIGVDIQPNDIDIIIHTKDFYKVNDLFLDAVVEPFVDNKSTWLVRYFGRLCIEGAIVDIVADEKMNIENHHYDKVVWNGYDVFIEPLQTRYALEQKRGRAERLKAMPEYMDRN